MVDLIPDTAFGRRARERLQTEKVIWLTTVGQDGTPQPNPVWFIWDGGAEIITYNLPDSHRLAHIARRPHVSLNFDSDGAGMDIVVLRGVAERVDDVPPPDESADYTAKYGTDMIRISGSAAAFAASYSAPVRITIDRIRGY
ncbi:MAG TPA: TIGR03667 family PPOX class F420-dependent oxidoreductase [Jiangellaceae bacterium]